MERAWDAEALTTLRFATEVNLAMVHRDFTANLVTEQQTKARSARVRTIKEVVMRRILRTYESIAQRYHWCDRCCSDILPGECYRGSVEIVNGKFFIMKTHENPGCEYPPDPDEKEFEADKASDFEWRLAA